MSSATPPTTSATSSSRRSSDSLQLAETLIERMPSKFDIGKFEDGYETAVKALVEAKVNNLPVPIDEASNPQRQATSSTSWTRCARASAPTRPPPKSPSRATKSSPPKALASSSPPRQTSQTQIRLTLPQSAPNEGAPSKLRLGG